MRINNELIRRCSSKHLLPLQSSEEDHLERITHLYLQEQHIRRIENLHSCRNLIALYLYDNNIEQIENLDHLISLNYLYLHKNSISRIENLDMLSQLTVLNLGHNSISKLEGLEALCELRELYIQYQKLPEDQRLEFDPATVTWLSDSLRVLNVSGNRLRSFSPLRALEYLENFTAEENEVWDLQDLVHVLGGWKYLSGMKLTGNPVCNVRKYRDNVVVTCLELEELDGKVIPQPYRNFLLNWKQCQSLHDRKKESYAVLKPFLETRQYIAGQVANIPNTVHNWVKDQLSSTWDSVRSNYKSACDSASTVILSIPESLTTRRKTCFAQCSGCNSKYYVCPPGIGNGPNGETPPLQPTSGYWLYVQPPADTFKTSLFRNECAKHSGEKGDIEHGSSTVVSFSEDQWKEPQVECSQPALNGMKAVTKGKSRSATVRSHPYYIPYFLRSMSSKHKSNSLNTMD